MHLPGIKTIVVAAVTAALAGPGAAGALGAPACAPIPASYDPGGAPTSAFPNDPLYAHQWGLTQIKAREAWARGALGAGAIIAVVDTGVDLNHPDLNANLVQGVNKVTGETCDPGPQDLNGHGTHVAGIAAAQTNNGIGVAGTAPLAKIMPVRVLDKDGNGSTDDIAAGIRYAADHGAQVINLSLADAIPLPIDLSGIAAAVDYAYSKGSVIVAAAGNESLPFCEYPSMSRNAICVAANDSSGFPSFYSNFPLRLDGGVAVRAPGGSGFGGCGDEDVWSTYWPAAGDDSCGPRGYEPLAGSSMATPFVSGIAAMLRGAGVSNAGVMECLKRNSSNGGTYDPVRGYGNVNADAAVAGCAQLSTGGGSLPGGSGQSTGGGTGTTPSPPPGGSGGVEGETTASDATAPRIRVAFSRTRKAHTARARYAVIRVRLNEPAAVLLRVMSGRQTAAAGRNAVLLAEAKVMRVGRGTRSIKARLTKLGRRVLRRRRAVTATVLAVARDAAGNYGTAVAEGKLRR
jgi:subtilisin family serine protease